MPEATPRVSVLFPAYNAERYLREALGSILAQTFNDLECIVVDDGSADRTPEILQAFAQRDDRLRIISRPNTGIVGALNDGLTECRGEYVARMDADDIAYPERLTRQVAYLQKNPGCVGVGAWVKYIDPDGEAIWTWKMSGNPGEIEKGLLEGHVGGLVHPAMLMRRRAMLAVGGYRQDCIYVEDYDLFLRMLNQGYFSVVQQCLLGYRQHLASINATRDRERRTVIKNRLLAEARRKRGLPPKTLTAKPASAEGTLLEWVDLALLDGNFRSAMRTTWRLFKLKPYSKTFFAAKWRFNRALFEQLKIKLGGLRRRVSKK